MTEAVDRTRAAASIWRAAAGCAECRITHPRAYDSCRTTPAARTTPLSVMAGDVIGASGTRIRPARFIRAYLPKLAPEHDDTPPHERASA